MDQHKRISFITTFITILFCKPLFSGDLSIVLGEVDKNAQRVAIAVLLQGISSPEESEEGNAGLVDVAAGVSSNRMIDLAGKKVRDVPVFNNHNVFYPEE